MAGAGLKKWMPHTRSGRSVTIAISTTGSVDVFVARIADGAQTRSSSPKRSCFADRSSTIDSRTRSQAASSSSAVTARTRPRTSAATSSSMRPFFTWRASDASRPASIASAPSCVRLRSTTSKPDAAATSATPAPMIPEPTTPMRLTAIAHVPLWVPVGERSRLPAGNLSGVIRASWTAPSGVGLVSARWEPAAPPVRSRWSAAANGVPGP